MKPLSVGLNCATGGVYEDIFVHYLIYQVLHFLLSNAGLPDEDGHYHESPSSLAEKVKRFAEEGWINIIGGCCGTTPEHIKAMKSALASLEAS